MLPDEEGARLWARRDLVRLPATVTRVGSTFVSLALPAPYGVVSVPWSAPPLRVGNRVKVAGEPIGSPPFVGFRALVVQVRLLFRASLVAIPQFAIAADVPPSAPQPWLEVLVRRRLLEAASLVGPDLYGRDPVSVLIAAHAPRAARDRGFVHYDVAWGNDTDDLIGDLAALLGRPEAFTQLAIDRDAITFEVRTPDGGVVRDRVTGFDGDLEQIADRMNHWARELGVDRRIWSLDTGIDRWAFLGRTPRELDAMATEGLPLDDLIPSRRPPPKKDAAEDWSDVI